MRYTTIDSVTGELKLYGEVSTWWNNAADFTDTLAEMDRIFSTIRLRIHSIGGSVFEGSVIFNALLATKAYVEIYIDGIAASMASIIMLAGKKIYMADNAFIMIHAPSTTMMGNANDYEKQAKVMRSMEQNFTKAYALKTGKTQKEAAKWLNGENHWLSASEAKAEGLIDEIIEPLIISTVTTPPASLEEEGSFFDRYAALLDDSTQNQNSNSSMKAALILALGLAAFGVTAQSTDNEVLDAAKKQKEDFEATIKAQKEEQVKAIITAAATARGKDFDVTMQDTLMQIGLKAGIGALQASLGLQVNQPPQPQAQLPQQQQQMIPQRPQVPVITDMLSGAQGGTTPTMTWDDYQAKDQPGLEKMEKERPEEFKALYFNKWGKYPEL